MIVSHHRRLILVRPGKAASTRIQNAFLVDLAKGYRVAGLNRNRESSVLESKATIGFIADRGPWKVRSHSSLSRLARVMGPEVLTYRVITIARNPWDRAVSEFYWLSRYRVLKDRSFPEQKFEFLTYLKNASRVRPVRSFLDWIEGAPRTSMLDQSYLYTINGVFRADSIIYFENIAASLEQVGKEIGIDLHLPEERSKGGTRPAQSRDWRSIYDQEGRDIVRIACAGEIRHFGYDFDAAVLPGGGDEPAIAS